MKRVIERNRQIKKIARRATWKWEKAFIHSIDCNRANIRLGNSPTVIRNVAVIGDIQSLVPTSEVSITWKDGRPVVLAPGFDSQGSNASSTSTGGNVNVKTIKVLSTAAVTLVNATDTYLSFDTVVLDTHGLFDAVDPTTIIIEEAGLYTISAEVSYVGNATGARAAKIFVNDVEISRGQIGGNATAVSAHVSCTALLQVGDRLQVAAYQNSTSALSTLIIDGVSPALTLVRIKDSVTVEQTVGTTIIQQGGGGGTSGPHAASHQAGGLDQIDLTGLAGMTAANVSTDTAAFNGMLTAAEDTVQKALEKLDDAVMSSGSGDIVGPASSVAGHAAVFGGATGKVLADAGFAPTLPNLLVNKSGQIAYAGDVAIFDTANANAFKYTTSTFDLRAMGVVVETIAVDATGRVESLAGKVVSVNCDAGAVAIGQFLMTSTTPGKATAAGYFRAMGTFAIAMSAKAAGSTGTVTAMLIDNYRQAIGGTAGYAFGGQNGSGSVMTGQKFNYASATWASLATANLPAVRSMGTGLTDTTVAAYSIAGTSTAISTNAQLSAYRMPFATETTAAQPSANLAAVKNYLRSGFSGRLKGYMVGGHNSAGTLLATVEILTFVTSMTVLCGDTLGSARYLQSGLSDGTYAYARGGTGAACDRIVFATDVIALSAGAYLPAAQGGLGSFSIAATAGYNFTSTYCRKIAYATGLDAGVASTPGNATYTTGVTDGISGGYSAGSGTAPYDHAHQFDAPTEIWSASSSSLAIGSFGSQQSSFGTYS